MHQGQPQLLSEHYPIIEPVKSLEHKHMIDQIKDLFDN